MSSSRSPFWRTAAALSVTGLLLAGCSTDTTSSAAADSTGDQEPVEIVFESYNLNDVGTWSETIEGLIEEFEDENPHITVVAQGIESDNTASSVQQQILAGSAPDVAQLTFNTLEFAIDELGAVNLTEYAGEELEEHFEGEYPYHPNARVLADRDGQTYGMPYVFSTPVLWINETLVEGAGLDPEALDLSTWDALKEAAEQVTAHTGQPSFSSSCVISGGSWCMQSMFLSNGADVLSEDRSTIEFGSPEAAQTVEVFQDFYESGLMPNEDTATQYESFARGDSVAFHVNTSALQGAFMGGAEAAGWTLNATTLPAFGDHEVVPTNSGSALMMFSEDPAKQEAAWELIKFFTSERAYEELTTGIGYLPLRSSMAEEGGTLHEWVQENPLVEPNLQQLESMKPWKAYPGNSYQQVDVLLATAIEEVVFQGADAETELQEAARRSQELIAE
ncbi:ABC transporter substrate-binding protein [Nesterenkonia flava]|uniref:ABC transporter substrate-binding protein n=1 Tax=Nesterenkonia flava TaxID=469799 RepID=A0ABU1FSE2_9MICC|nr:ABC transporter substrate-binding protein [Nesterenkonia flava]MDR5711579.1 ABC transporter substrate-binding protein [Nesterenkonia flava]